LGRIGNRLRKPRDLGECVDELEREYEGLRQDFAAFYPALQAHVISK